MQGANAAPTHALADQRIPWQAQRLAAQAAVHTALAYTVVESPHTESTSADVTILPRQRGLFAAPPRPYPIPDTTHTAETTTVAPTPQGPGPSSTA